MTRLCLMLVLALCLTFQGKPAVAQDDRSHDFDFLFGTWKTHIRMLKPGGRWATIDGVVNTRKVWGGKANVEQIEAPASSGFEGMTLRLYDPSARQWRLYWANSSDGTVGVPSVGKFQNGRGTFYSHDLIDGVATYVRQVYYDATPTAYKFEESLSHDAGKTWHPDFTASLTRADNVAIPYPHVAESAQQHGFDWQFGLWKIHMRRLLHALTSQAAWADLNGTVDVLKIWNGRANIAEVVVGEPGNRLEIVGLRLYQPQSKQWTLAFANSGSGQLGSPMYGTFADHHGAFYDQEDYHGRMVWDRFEFFTADRNEAKDLESVSVDGGKTWVPIFYNVHTRVMASR